MTVDGAANLDWLTAGVMLRKYWLLLASAVFLRLRPPPRPGAGLG